MKSFKVSAHKIIGCEAIVYAENKEAAFNIANLNSDELDWKEFDQLDFAVQPDKNVKISEAKEFPYEEIRDAHGDVFLSLGAAFAKLANMQNLSISDMTTEWRESVLKHIWAVIITDTEEGVAFTFTDPRHYVNREGFIITKEARQHDNEEYNEEVVMESAACS